MCYHVIGDALRRCGAPTPGFAERFAARLDVEPTVLAPKTAHHGSRLPLTWAVAATVAAVFVVGSVAVSMLDPQPTAIAKAREANVVRAAQSKLQPVSPDYSDRASGVLAHHADPGRGAVLAGGFSGGRGWPPVASRSLEYLRAARSGIRPWGGPAGALEYLRASRSGIRPWGGPAGVTGVPSRFALRYSPLGRPGGLMSGSC